MTTKQPVAELDARFSSEGAQPTAWDEARGQLEQAEVYWLTTVREDGRPHVTPLIGVWADGAAHFCTGAGEQKARNLAHYPQCALTTGCNALGEGLDVVLEGEAVRVVDDAALQRVADAYLAKYGDDWRFTVRDGAFHQGDGSSEEGDSGAAIVFAVAPWQAFGFRKGDYSQTRWRFA
jgi:hypothetical protein